MADDPEIVGGGDTRSRLSDRMGDLANGEREQMIAGPRLKANNLILHGLEVRFGSGAVHDAFNSERVEDRTPALEYLARTENRPNERLLGGGYSLDVRPGHLRFLDEKHDDNER